MANCIIELLSQTLDLYGRMFDIVFAATGQLCGQLQHNIRVA